MPELVSILIPAYNAEKWIGDTIRSALNQTWPNKEIIIVDDGSTDNTLKVAKKFESTVVKVIAQENAGACGARNKALSFAQGSYVQWLDADDLLAPDKISQQLKESGSGYSSRVLFGSAFGTFFFRHQKAKFVPNSLWHDLAPVEWIITKFNNNIWMNPAVWLVSRELTDLAGLWDERLSLDDDGEYFCRVVASSERVEFVPEAKSYYRVGNTGSLSKRTSYKACESLLLSLTLCFEHLLLLENSERTRSACLKYLKIWLPYFYPEKPKLMNRMNDLAHELGGSLPPPEVSWKYYPIEKVMGWEIAKKVMTCWRSVKSKSYKNWDRLLYHLTYKTSSLDSMIHSS